MTALVLVPWRTDNGQRAAVWSFLRAQVWHDFEVVEGGHDDGPFSRSRALNDAATRAGDWDVAVIADADMMLPQGQVQAAIEQARHTRRLVLAHNKWMALSEQTTAAMLAGNDPQLIPAGFRRDPVSGVMAIGRPLWDAVGGFDEHFTQYGWEDHAFVRACDLHGGFVRVPGPAWHLWHEPVRFDSWTEYGQAAINRATAYFKARTVDDLAQL